MSAGGAGARTVGTEETNGVDVDHDRSLTSWTLPVALVLVVGFLVSIVSVGRASFSLDESVSTSLAYSPWHVFTQSVLHREANMSLYYLALRVWDAAVSGVTGSSLSTEAMVRSLSVVATVGALAVVMVVTRRLFGRRSALICGVLLALDPLVVMFAQDGRGYALSLLLVSASSALFVRGLRHPSPRAVWVAYAVVSALAAYANFWAALVPLAHGASLAFLPPRSAPWRRLIPTGAGLALLLVPLALLIHATDSSGVNWAAGSSAGKLFTTVRADIPHPVIDLAVVLVVALVVWIVALVRRHPRLQITVDRWPVVFALCWLVVPVAAVVLLSLAYKPLLVLRYLVICLPPFVMLVADALARLKAVRARAGAVAALVIVSAVGVGALFAHGSSQDWRGAVASVADRARPGDGVVIFAPYTRIPFQWYVVKDAVQDSVRPLFPAGSWSTNALRYDTSIAVSPTGIEADVAGHRRVWLVLSQQTLYPSEDAAVLGGLRAAGLGPDGTRTFHGVEVVLYSQRR